MRMLQKAQQDALMKTEQDKQKSTDDSDKQRAVVDVKRQAREDAMKVIQAQQPIK